VQAVWRFNQLRLYRWAGGCRSRLRLHVARRSAGPPNALCARQCLAIFFPKLLANLFAAVSIVICGSSGFAGLVLFWVSLTFATVAFVMLYRITRNYVTIPPTTFGDHEL
jgi:hypothetical protein